MATKKAAEELPQEEPTAEEAVVVEDKPTEALPTDETPIAPDQPLSPEEELDDDPNTYPKPGDRTGGGAFR